MPSIVVCGRVLPVATDEFVWSAGWSVLLHGITVAFYAVAYSSVELGLEVCTSESARLIKAWYIACLVVYSTALLLDLSLAYASSRGGLKDVDRRKRSVPVLLILSSLVLVLELVWGVGFGIYFVFVRRLGCDSLTALALELLRAAVAINIVAFVLAFLGGTFVSAFARKIGMSSSKMWERRLRTICCCGRLCEMCSTSRSTPDHDYMAAFSAAAQLLSDSLQPFDVVPSDAMAGFAFVRARQKQDERRRAQERYLDEHDQVVPSDVVLVKEPRIRPACAPGGRNWVALHDQRAGPQSRRLMLGNSDDRDAVLELAHFSKYMLAAYGWPLWLFTHPLTGCCRLLPCGCAGACCCYTCASAEGAAPPQVHGDACQWNRRAIELFIDSTGATRFVDFSNALFKMPYYIAVDTTRNAVVIAIRGTLSLRDALVDIAATPAQTLYDGPDTSEPDCRAHHGILQSARRIHSDIMDRNVLRTLLENEPHLRNIVVVGHSLGAGAAALLAPLTRRAFPQHHIRCLSYSPPGGLVSPALYRELSTYTLCCVLGKDMIPRSSIESVTAIISEASTACQRSSLPKWKVSLSIFMPWRSLAKTDLDEVAHPSRMREDSRLLERDSIVTSVSVSVDAATSAQQQSHLDSSAKDSTTDEPIALHLPGPVIHLVKTETRPRKNNSTNSTRRRCCSRKQGPEPLNDGRVFRSEWADATAFDEILVSPLMVTDHLPNHVADVLDDVASSLLEVNESTV